MGRNERSTTTERPTLNLHHAPLPPLPESELASVQHYAMTRHLIERMNQRGIGVMEVYSAIAAPESTRSARDNSTIYVRGDLKVVVSNTDEAIVTVSDRDEDFRTEPRVPLNPLHYNHTEPHQGAAVATTKRGESTAAYEAWCLVPRSEEAQKKILMTPSLAEKLLADHNPANRPLKAAVVRDYVEQIENDEWRTTHQGMAIDSAGNLQDGQHRLHAIVKSGKAQWVWMAVGTDPDNFNYVDVGRNRSYGDVLALQGFSDPNILGATARLVYVFLGRGFGAAFKVTNAQVAEVVREDEAEMAKAITMGRRLSRRLTGMNSGAAGAAYYLIRRVHKKGGLTRVEEFFEGLATGAGIPADDPRLRLAIVVSEARKVKRRYAMNAEHLALILKCWRIYITGTNAALQYMRKNETYPTVARLEGVK